MNFFKLAIFIHSQISCDIRSPFSGSVRFAGKAYGKVDRKESATRALLNWKGGRETGMG